MIKSFRGVIPGLCSILLSTLLLSGCGDKKATDDIPVGTVTKGIFYLDLFEEGEMEATKSVNISSPSISWRYGDLKINWIVKDGEELKAGDTLIRFDPSEVQKGIVDVEAILEVSLAELKKMEAQHQSDLEELNADYEISEISQEISRIRFESAAYESEIKRREIQLNLDKADISLTRAKEQIENRIKIQKEEIKQKNLSIKQNQNQYREGKETLEKLNVITNSPGIAIINRNNRTDSKFQIGEQVWSSYPLIQLPDLSKMKAVVRINEVDISKISSGLEVEIRPDAFSEKVFKGKVVSVANLAVNKEGSSKIKIFPVEIVIEGENKELLPGMTVSCRIIIDKLDDVLYVPHSAVTEEIDKSYVYVKSGNGYDKREVVTGKSNTDYIVIQEGLKENEKIALVDPYANSGEDKVVEEDQPK